MIFPSLHNENSIKNKLSLLERREIDGNCLQFPEHLPFLSEFKFHRLRGKPLLIDQNVQANVRDNTVESLLVGLFASQTPFCYVIDAFPDHIEIYFGSRGEKSSRSFSVHRSMLEGYWGAENVLDGGKVNERIKKLSGSSVCGALTGIPGPVIQSPAIKKIVPADQWLRSLQGRRWTYLINGFPVQREMLVQYADHIIAEIALLKTQTIREDILHEDKRLAEHYQGLLEANLKRLESGRLIGAWQTGVYFFADNEPLIRQGLAMMSSLLGGKKSIVQPVRSHLCYKKDELKPSFCNLLVSSETAPLISFPEEEAPGYVIRKVARFDTDPIDSNCQDPVSIGHILRNWIVTDNKYEIETSDLSKHGLIAGVTGSGKTTTCFHVLKQLKRKKIPFLIIESAKSEYRQLLNAPMFKDLLIFTLGDETPGSSAPFRINPFEVPEGILIQTHLDYLKALFRASFVMYAPMPYVLEEALHEIYRDKGWNLSLNSNERGRGYRAFPTLTDLHEKIDDVVTRIGYDERISKDILAGLKTRINNLRLGGKGLMLDTHYSVPIAEIMKRPVLLELKRIGNDDEKAFLIGLILTRIYEYYEGVGISSSQGQLKHLTLIEEAHRLLKHVPENSSESDGNVKGQAVETFCNILSEIRAYGEGLLVSEQIPGKLARDVLKNTNLKIMHRIVAKDDRDILGDTMNLTDEQKTYATTLEKGRAVVFAEGMDSPFLIYVPMDDFSNEKIMENPVTNSLVCQHMKTNFYTNHKAFLFKYRECVSCSIEQRQCENVSEAIKMLLSKQQGPELFNRLFLSAAFGKMGPALFDDIGSALRENLVLTSGQNIKNVCLCFGIQAVYQSVEAQGRLYRYSFEEMENLIISFIGLLRLFLIEGRVNSKDVESFRSLVVRLRTKPAPPFTGCLACDKICLYRFESAHLLKDFSANIDFEFISTKISDDKKMWTELTKLCLKMADRLIRTDDQTFLKSIALCYLSQKIAKAGYASTVQKKIARNVYEASGTLL